MLGFSQLSAPLKWQDLLEKGKKAAMRFEQVQRFILAKKIFWGYGHFNLGKMKMKICPQALTSLTKPQIWLFLVVVLLTTTKKWTKVKNARFWPLNV